MHNAELIHVARRFITIFWMNLALGIMQNPRMETMAMR
jgi:hypothetical protein